MSNPTNPFFDVDFSKFMDMSKMMDTSKMADMSKMMDMSKFSDFSKTMSECKLPNMDIESMMAAQRKGLEAIATNNQKAFENMQAYMRRQSDLARQSMEATSGLMQAVMAAPTAEEKVAKQVEATKTTIEGCVSSLKELSELLSQSHVETMQTVSSAVCEGIDNIKGMMKK